MRFLVEPVSKSLNASLEERATMCDLRIDVAGSNACSFWDDRDGSHYEWVRVASVHLAEGIASDWWTIFGGRDRRHSILPYRNGYILPNLNFSCDGSHFEVSGDALHCENPGLRFWPVGSELLLRADAEAELAGFVHQVIDLLHAGGVREAEVELQWSLVSDSRNDPEERAFCEAAGALGVDPYRIDDADADFIEFAGRLLEDDALLDYLAGARNLSRTQRNFQTTALSGVLAGKSDARFLPGLSDVCDAVKDSYRIRGPAERPWTVGYRCASAFRGALGLSGDANLGGVSGLAKRLGNAGFERTPDLAGLSAVVNRAGGFYVYLREGKYTDGPSDNFSFCRAVGDAVCFPKGGASVVNGLQVAERQSMTRAFAAEVLAPAERVLDMRESGWTTEQIGDALAVSTELVERQVENRHRIEEIIGNSS